MYYKSLLYQLCFATFVQARVMCLVKKCFSVSQTTYGKSACKSLLFFLACFFSRYLFFSPVFLKISFASQNIISMFCFFSRFKK